MVSALRGSAAKDSDLSAYDDLLAVIEEFAVEGTEELAITQAPALEAAERARIGRGTVWAAVATYVEAGADPDALLRAHLDYDRIGEYTGNPVAKVLSREGEWMVVQCDGARKIGPIELGARWQFKGHRIRRGAARIFVTAKISSPDESHMIATHGLIMVFPEAGRVRVVEASCAAVDLWVPGFVRSIAAGIAETEMKQRVAGIRAHWREYAK